MQAPMPMHLARIEQGSQTRTRLVEAARALLVEHGAEGTSLQRIAQQVGVTVGAVQSHFGSKTGLLIAVLERSQEDAEQRWFDALDRLARSEDWVADLVDVLWELSSDDLIIARQEVQRAARHDPEVARRFQELTSTDIASAEQIASTLGVACDQHWQLTLAAVASLVSTVAQARGLEDPEKTQVSLKRISAWCAPLLRR